MSSVETLPNIGKVLAERLKKAGIEELMRVRGINRDLAERIYAAFHG